MVPKDPLQCIVVQPEAVGSTGNGKRRNRLQVPNIEAGC